MQAYKFVIERAMEVRRLTLTFCALSPIGPTRQRPAKWPRSCVFFPRFRRRDGAFGSAGDCGRSRTSGTIPHLRDSTKAPVGESAVGLDHAGNEGSQGGIEGSV